MPTRTARGHGTRPWSAAAMHGLSSVEGPPLWRAGPVRRSTTQSWAQPGPVRVAKDGFLRSPQRESGRKAAALQSLRPRAPSGIDLQARKAERI